MVVTDAVSESDAEVEDVEFDPTNQTPADEVFGAAHNEVPLESLLTPASATETMDVEENTFLQDSLVPFNQLLDVLPASIQTQWASKFVTNT